VTGNQRGFGLVRAVWTVAGLLVIAVATIHIVHQVRSSDTKFETSYQAVLLTNGSVYFGHLHYPGCG
jgi:membrane protein YdbS with pleckstrin-like domain